MKFWGICHPPGFPLYILVGNLFTSIFPFETLIFKANFLSAVFAAGTILLVYLCLTELKVQRAIALLLALFLAVSAAFWEFSLSADVFTFGALLIALTFFLTFKNKPLWAFLALVLSASHFYISAILAPLLVWYFFRESEGQSIGESESQRVRVSESQRVRIIRKLFIWGLVFSLGFFPQVLLYLRMQKSPQINWGHAEGLSGFIYFVRRQEFGSIFLLANPVLQFNLLKVVKHFYLYFANLATSFGVILPIITLPVLALGRLFANRKVTLVFLSYVFLVSVQLVLLSTIDPTGEDNPFQINKFYISSFVLFVFLMGAALNWIIKRLFGEESMYALLLLFVFIVIYLAANFRTNNYAGNYFSQKMVEDALSELPQDSVAITVSHIVYFGGLYEQKVNGRFKDITLLYFPNEKNRDNEKYHSELFSRPVDSDFVKTVQKGKGMGDAEKYVLWTIAQNLDRDIYILQGTFEEGFFAYLKPYIKPYGMWWRVVSDPYAAGDAEKSQRLLSNLQNGDVKFSDLHLKQQQLDTLNYAVSYHSTGVALAAEGKYDAALGLLEKSLRVREKGDNIQKEIELVKKTKQLVASIEKLAAAKDESGLTELGNNLFTLGNFSQCAEVFSQLSEIDDKDARTFNNLASCQASLGKKDEARQNYQKALGLDPNLDMAKKGLEALGE